MGGAQHLTGEMFNKTAGIDMTAIHYQGSAPGTLDMIGGRIDIMFDGAGTGLANVRSGQLKAIAMGSDARAAGAPDLPTWKEGGVNMSAYTWYGIFAPVGTPQPILEKLHKAITVAIDSKPYKDRLAQAEAEIPHTSIAETVKFVEDDASGLGRPHQVAEPEARVRSPTSTTTAAAARRCKTAANAAGPGKSWTKT